MTVATTKLDDGVLQLEMLGDGRHCHAGAWLTPNGVRLLIEYPHVDPGVRDALRALTDAIDRELADLEANPGKLAAWKRELRQKRAQPRRGL